MIDPRDLPGKDPTDMIRRRYAESVEHEMTRCLLCDGEGTIVLRVIGHDMVLVCRGCGSTYKPAFKPTGTGLWYVGIRSIGNVRGKDHLVGNEYLFPFDLKRIAEDGARAIPGKPPTLKSSIKRESIIRNELKNCILCMGEDTLRMRTFGHLDKLVCTKCGAMFKPLFSLIGSRFQTIKIASVGGSGAPKGWEGRGYMIPVNHALIAEDLVHELPGEPASIKDDLKLESLIEKEVHGCMICGHYDTIRFRRLRFSSKLVCRDCHTIYRPVRDLKVTRISKLIVESTGKLKNKPGAGTYIDLEEMKKSKGWRKAQYPPVVPVEGSTHGSHWWTVLGERDLMDLFDAQKGQKLHVQNRHVWRGMNIEHRKVMDNNIMGAVTPHEGVMIMLVNVNDTTWTSYPVSEDMCMVKADIQKVSSWPNRIEGWLNFNMEFNGSQAYLTGFDPQFFVHKGKVERKTVLGLLGFAYRARRGEDHEIENETTRRDTHVFPRGKGFVTQDTGWIMPMNMLRRSDDFNPDDYYVRMKVTERHDIRIFDEEGYLFKGRPFGADSDVEFPIIVRKGATSGDPPDIGSSLEAEIWLQACSSGTRTNGLDLKQIEGK